MNPKVLRALTRAIATAPSKAEFARRVGVSRQTLYNMMAHGVERRHLTAIVRAAGGTVRAEELRPDL